MRALFLAHMLFGFVVACAAQDTSPDYSHTKPGYYGGDGSSAKQAVIAVGFDQSAYAWIAKKYPGSTVLSQSLVVPPGKKRYDVYEVRLRNKKVIHVWFLISGGLDSLFEELGKEHQ
jgi:hypothetical protein